VPTKSAAFITEAGITAEALPGNKSQGQQEHARDAFRVGTVQVLVAPDIAAGGIDVDTVTHVLNYDLPSLPKATSTAPAARSCAMWRGKSVAL
jgi:ATP-dependent RNA helicase RhlE